MSLLEDVFLQDEAGEAQELERIIEGDEYEERQRRSSDSDENSEKDDEAVEDKRRVDPTSTKTKRVAKNPRFVLNPARLTGPRGISVIPEHFKDFKFKGKGYEKEDLDLVLKKLEHWAYRLYPKFKFEDCLKKIETLGKKRVVSVHLHKIRSDQLITEDTVVQKDSSDEEELAVPLPQEDEFDQLLQQQIELARATPARGETRSGFSTPATLNKRSPLNTIMPKSTSSPSISDEQKERMIRNRKLAEERRLARLKTATLTKNGNTTIDLTNDNIHRNELPTVIVEVDDVLSVSNDKRAKKNRSNVIDSSDDDDDTIHETVTIDVHEPVDQNMIDLTNGDHHQTQKSITGKEKDSEVEITAFKNDADETINLSEDSDIPKIVKMIDLTEVQESNNITNNVEDMEIQNGHDQGISNDQPETVKTIIDLTEIQAHKTSIRNNEVDKEKAGIQNKISDVVVSSDDDDDTDTLVINEAVVVDVHKDKEINTSNQIRNAVANAEENKVADDHKDKEINTSNQRRNAVANAEENKVADDLKQKSSNIDESEAVICEFDDITKTSIHVNRSSEIEIATSVQNDGNSETATNIEILGITTPITQKSHDNNKEVDILNHDKKEDIMNAESNSNIEDVLDDLMDVDFSEDF